MSKRAVVAAFVSFALVGFVGCSDSSESSSPDQPAESVEPVDVDSSSSSSEQPPLPRLVVGTDISPGLNIADELGTCYYARLGSVDGSPDNALGQSNALGEQVFVTIEPSDKALISVACGPWRLATEADTSQTPGGGIPDDGMWLVPEHISPGTYQTVASDLPKGCFYQTLADLSASLDAALQTEQGLSGQVTMTIGPDVRAVRAYRCGEWSKVSG